MILSQSSESRTWVSVPAEQVYASLGEARNEAGSDFGPALHKSFRWFYTYKHVVIHPLLFKKLLFKTMRLADRSFLNGLTRVSLAYGRIHYD